MHLRQETITLYRGWKPDQSKYYDFAGTKVGTNIEMKDTPIYSWTILGSNAVSFGSGSVNTKAEVPINKLILTDFANPTHYTYESEFPFKGIPTLKIEVIASYG